MTKTTTLFHNESGKLDTRWWVNNTLDPYGKLRKPLIEKVSKTDDLAHLIYSYAAQIEIENGKQKPAKTEHLDDAYKHWVIKSSTLRLCVINVLSINPSFKEFSQINALALACVGYLNHFDSERFNDETGNLTPYAQRRYELMNEILSSLEMPALDATECCINPTGLPKFDIEGYWIARLRDELSMPSGKAADRVNDLERKIAEKFRSRGHFPDRLSYLDVLVMSNVYWWYRANKLSYLDPFSKVTDWKAVVEQICLPIVIRRYPKVVLKAASDDIFLNDFICSSDGSEVSYADFIRLLRAMFNGNKGFRESTVRSIYKRYGLATKMKKRTYKPKDLFFVFKVIGTMPRKRFLIDAINTETFDRITERSNLWTAKQL